MPERNEHPACGLTGYVLWSPDGRAGPPRAACAVTPGAGGLVPGLFPLPRDASW